MTSVLEAIWWIVAGWVAIDAARRRRLWFAWALLVCSTTFVGLTIWLLVRRLTPAGALAGGRTTAIWLGLSAIPVGVLSLILVTWTTTYVGQVAEIEGDAMAPALVHHDDVLVNRMAYRTALPGRGDVVLLRYPLKPDTLFVRRVVAVEGDRLHIRDGLVFVNNAPRPDTEVAPDSRSHDDWGPQVIPEGYCFVMGDRRNNSSDSRHWGMVPEKYVLGRVTYHLTGSHPLAIVR